MLIINYLSQNRVKLKKGSCKVYTAELDPGLYIVRVYGKDDKIYIYKYIVKGEEE